MKRGMYVVGTSMVRIPDGWWEAAGGEQEMNWRKGRKDGMGRWERIWWKTGRERMGWSR